MFNDRQTKASTSDSALRSLFFAACFLHIFAADRAMASENSGIGTSAVGKTNISLTIPPRFTIKEPSAIVSSPSFRSNGLNIDFETNSRAAAQNLSVSVDGSMGAIPVEVVAVASPGTPTGPSAYQIRIDRQALAKFDGSVRLIIAPK